MMKTFNEIFPGKPFEVIPVTSINKLIKKESKTNTSLGVSLLVVSSILVLLYLKKR